MEINFTLSAATCIYTVYLRFRFIMHHISSILKKPVILVLSVSKALIIIPFSSEQLVVVKDAVEFPM